MSAGSWYNNDTLYLQYGTRKAVSELGGDYKSYGDTREMEIAIVLGNLTTLPLIQSYTTFFPAVNGTQYVMIEEVSIVSDTACTGTSGTLSVGLGTIATNSTTDPATVTAITNNAFINALPVASFATLGSKTTFTLASGSLTTYGGVEIGNAITYPAVSTTSGIYVTALYATTALVGTVRVRIRYRTYNVISQ